MPALRHLVLACLLIALAACAARRGGGSPELGPAAEIAADRLAFQTGVASWYGDDFHGKATANGEIYDMHKLTAAHPDLPFHTILEVENLENGKTVRVRVNDRGPFLKGRIIDLSLKAARRLGIDEKGTAEVSLRVVRLGGGAMAADASAPARGGCCVQAGAFARRENAEDLLQTLADIFPGPVFRMVEEDGMFKVISAPGAAPADCDELIRELAARHLQGFVRECAESAGK